MTVQITKERMRQGAPNAEWRAAVANLTGPPANLLPLTAAMTQALAIGEAVVAMARDAVARLSPEEQRRALAHLESRGVQR